MTLFAWGHGFGDSFKIFGGRRHFNAVRKLKREMRHRDLVTLLDDPE